MGETQTAIIDEATYKKLNKEQNAELDARTDRISDVVSKLMFAMSDAIEELDDVGDDQMELIESGINDKVYWELFHVVNTALFPKGGE